MIVRLRIHHLNACLRATLLSSVSRVFGEPHLSDSEAVNSSSDSQEMVVADVGFARGWARRPKILGINKVANPASSPVSQLPGCDKRVAFGNLHCVRRQPQTISGVVNGT